MGKIFYAEKSEYSSEAIVTRILSQYYEVENAEIKRTKNGKPYLENVRTPLHFSLSHTKELLFIAFSEENIGLDTESLHRKVDYEKICAKFPCGEREKITSVETFLKHWVVKESAVKYMGGTLAKDLKKLSLTHGLLTYEGQPFPVSPQFLQFREHILCVCSRQDFSNAEFVEIPICTL